MNIRGVYPPVPTFFDADEELDLPMLHAHIMRLRHAGITNVVALGSNGEAVYLDMDERFRVIETIREAAGVEAQVMAGAGAQSTRETIRLCALAAQAGADLALVLPPHHYGGRMGMATQRAHFLAVADASPLPVVIYNMPANAAGVDLDAETIIALAAHSNIVGVKDSSGNVTKLAQVVAGAPDDFAVLAGSAGFLLPALVVGARGVIAALANVAPRECLRLMDLYEQGALADARALQARLIPVNTAVTGGYGVAGLKAALELTGGYGGAPRRPLAPVTDGERERLRLLLAEADMLAAKE